MKTRISIQLLRPLPLIFLWMAFSANAQVPVDDQGNPLGNYQGAVNSSAPASQDSPATGNDGIPLLSPNELEELVGPVALYPDDLLAIVLPASTYPLQVVQAARFLEDLERDPKLEPNSEWDDSVIALVNYPEVVELLNDDLDWTWRLGEAVVAQQNDVINAVEEFRDRAYAAGNLKSDSYQTVSRNDDVIEIKPVNEEIIYVPYYEPERVVYHQPRPVYYYYPRAYPVYYYPYSSLHSFNRGYFWGVTTAFTIGWRSDHLHVFHHSYQGHPYYGRSYYDRWWYRRPDIHAHNNVYIRNNVNVSVNHYTRGDYWRPSRNTRLRATDQRITRNTHYPSRQARQTTTNATSINRTVNSRRDGDTITRRTSGTERTVNQRQTGATRQRSQDDMRRTITTVQRERQANGEGDRRAQSRDGAGTQQRQTSQRASDQRETSEQRTTQRQSTEQRSSQQPAARRQVTRDEISQRLAMNRETQTRPSSQRQSQNRMPAERATERATTQRRSASRQTTRQETSAPRQNVQRQTTRQPQRSEHQATPRQSQRSEHRTAQQQPQRSERQTTQRQPERAERQAQTNSRKTDQSNTGRSQSSSEKSRSGRENNRRRTR